LQTFLTGTLLLLIAVAPWLLVLGTVALAVRAIVLVILRRRRNARAAVA
jgi:hypothetical protein